MCCPNHPTRAAIVQTTSGRAVCMACCGEFQQRRADCDGRHHVTSRTVTRSVQLTRAGRTYLKRQAA